jgi:hypothetical protein
MNRYDTSYFSFGGVCVEKGMGFEIERLQQRKQLCKEPMWSNYDRMDGSTPERQNKNGELRNVRAKIATVAHRSYQAL